MVPSTKPPVVLHLDLDGARSVFESHGWRWTPSRDPIFETGLGRALDFFRELGVSATLFTVARDLLDPMHRELVERALEAGHRVASHSFSHRRLAGLSPGEKDREVVESREVLERTLGVPVEGFRAPAYSLDGDVLKRVARAGYRFDSSLFPDRRSARKVGLPVVLPGPQRLDEGLWELPLPGRGLLACPFHPSYSLVLGHGHFRRGLLRHVETGHPLVLLFHLVDFAEPLAQLSGLRARLFTLSHLESAKKRERCLRMWNTLIPHYEVTDTMRLCPR